jgi:hypothetical protein
MVVCDEDLHALHVTPYALGPATIPKGIERERYWPPGPRAKQWPRQSIKEAAHMLDTLVTLAQAGSLLLILWGLALVLGSVFQARRRGEADPEAKAVPFRIASSL